MSESRGVGNGILTAVFVLSLVMFGVLLWITSDSMERVVATSGRVSQSYEARKSLLETASWLKDVQRGARGYLITGDDIFLRPYNAGIDSLTKGLASLKNVWRDDPEQLKRLDILNGLVQIKVGEIKEEILIFRGKGFDSVRAMLMKGEVEQTMIRVERVIEEMDNEADRLLEMHIEEERASEHEAFMILFGGSSVGLILILMVYLFLMGQARKWRKSATMSQRGEEGLKLVVNNVEEGITFSNSEGRFEVFNPKMRELTGYTAEEANRAPDFLSLLYPDPNDRQEALDGVQDVKIARGPRSRKTTIVTKSGQKRTLYVSSRVLRFGKRTMYLTTYREIAPEESAPAQM